jgi:NAD(P)-dependent dehydrogenase (short-subunit alcohol dehydrogenase family)
MITGSTRGIGFGLADAFLELGCEVAISGSNQENLNRAVEDLAVKHAGEHMIGVLCDVRKPDQVASLWDQAKAQFGKVDVWINNAGVSNAQRKIWDVPVEEVKRVVDINLIGTIHGSQVAIKGMLDQGYGAIYNMEGMGSDGRKHDGLTLYGMTKYGLKYFTDSLVKETKGSPIIVGALRPGMVVTELITKQYEDRPEEWEKDKRIFNILAERVEVVAPWMAEKILVNEKTGVRISYTSKIKLFGRFLMAPFSRRDVISDSI